MLTLLGYIIAATLAVAAIRAWAHKRESTPPARLHVEMVHGSGSFAIAAVGEASYVPAFEAICGPRTRDGENREVVATLVAEPENRFDSDAVYVSVDGRKVGYLPRGHEYGAVVRQYLARGVRPSCYARIRGGWHDRGDGDQGYYGIWLDLPGSSPADDSPKARPTPAAKPTVATAPSTDAELARVLRLKSDGPRRKASAELLASITDGETRTRVMAAIAKHETQLVLAHVATLVSTGPKRKRLEKAIQDIEADDVPDDLQQEEIRSLRAALDALPKS